MQREINETETEREILKEIRDRDRVIYIERDTVAEKIYRKKSEMVIEKKRG